MKRNKNLKFLALIGLIGLTSCGGGSSTDGGDSTTSALSFGTPEVKQIIEGTAKEGTELTDESVENKTSHFFLKLGIKNDADVKFTFNISKLKVVTSDNKEVTATTLFKEKRTAEETVTISDTSYKKTYTAYNSLDGQTEVEFATGEKNESTTQVDLNLTENISSFKVYYDNNEIALNSDLDKVDLDKYNVSNLKIHAYYTLKSGKLNESTLGNFSKTYSQVSTTDITNTYQCITTKVSLSSGSLTVKASDFSFKISGASYEGVSFLSQSTNSSLINSLTTVTYSVSKETTYTLNSGTISELNIQININSAPTSVSEMYYKGSAVTYIKNM